MMNSSEREVRVSKDGDKVRGWSSHKNPRIVRVSRSFGGKDRHSKVSTVKGLRDRRIRLSVPTAIQIYDLQHKLGLSQPSKAVDWLLDNTKNDIDLLPPLPAIPAANQSHFLSSNHPCNMIDERRQKDKWIHQENHDGFGAQNFFPLGTLNQPSFPSMPYNPNFHWDHPNLSLSHIGGVYPLPNQAVEYQTRNSEMYFCPTATIIPAFPSVENLQQNPLFPSALHLSSQNVNSKSVHPQQNDTPRSGKEE